MSFNIYGPHTHHHEGAVVAAVETSDPKASKKTSHTERDTVREVAEEGVSAVPSAATYAARQSYLVGDHHHTAGAFGAQDQLDEAVSEKKESIAEKTAATTEAMVEEGLAAAAVKNLLHPPTTNAELSKQKSPTGPQKEPNYFQEEEEKKNSSTAPEKKAVEKPKKTAAEAPVVSGPEKAKAVQDTRITKAEKSSDEVYEEAIEGSFVSKLIDKGIESGVHAGAMALGATIGSVIPVVGTTVGAVIGLGLSVTGKLIASYLKKRAVKAYAKKNNPIG